VITSLLVTRARIRAPFDGEIVSHEAGSSNTIDNVKAKIDNVKAKIQDEEHTITPQVFIKDKYLN
jgi:ribosomal protein S5